MHFGRFGLTNQLEEALVDLIRQIAGLHTAALGKESPSGALPRNRTTSKRSQKQGRARRHPLILGLKLRPNVFLGLRVLGVVFLTGVPELVVVGGSPGEERAQGARQRIALAPAALQASLNIGDERRDPVRNHIMGTLLDDGDTTQRIGQPLTGLRFLARPVRAVRLGVDFRETRHVDPQRFGQAAELVHVGRQDALFVPAHQIRILGHEEEPVGVEDKGNRAGPRFFHHLRHHLEGDPVATQAGSDHQAMQPRKHVDDRASEGWGIDGLGVLDRGAAWQNRVDHQVWRVGFDDLDERHYEHSPFPAPMKAGYDLSTYGGCRFITNNVALFVIRQNGDRMHAADKVGSQLPTISHPAASCQFGHPCQIHLEEMLT